MAYAYDRHRLSAFLHKILLKHISGDAAKWVSERQPGQFNMAFAAAPRFLGRADVSVTEEESKELTGILPYFSLERYTVDRLFRIWWLLQLPADDEHSYVNAVEQLFNAAEMNELVALYGALPLFAFPEAWKYRTAEGIRSNIGSVLEAVMIHNPYPARYLEEPAWNQLVLKAFFTEKHINGIVGLDERANAALASVLIDYAHERRAAGRAVHPLLWRLVGPFIGENNFEDIQRVWHSEQNAEREAAALACYMSNYPPARDLLLERPETTGDIAAGRLTWDTVARRVND